MSRINLKLPFDDMIRLQTACYKKHTDDGEESILISYLDYSNIDFAKDVANGAIAAAHKILGVTNCLPLVRWQRLKGIKISYHSGNLPAIGCRLLKKFMLPMKKH